MSDGMRPAVGAPMAPGSAPAAGGNAITNNLSMANPNDAAFMAQSGMVNPDMSMKDYLETTFKLPVTAPVKAFAEAVKGQVQQRRPMGKMQAVAGQGAQRPVQPAPQRPAAPVSAMGASLEEFANKYGA